MSNSIPTRALVILLCAMLSATCGGSNGTTGSSNPGGVTTTDTFTGTLDPSTSSWHNFMVSQTGTVTITLTSLSASVTVGLGIGTRPTNGCQVQAYNNASVIGTVISGAISSGAYCVTLYDVGSVTAPVNYTLTVVHP